MEDCDWQSEEGSVGLRLIDPHVLCEGMRRLNGAAGHLVRAVAYSGGYRSAALHVGDDGRLFVYGCHTRRDAATEVIGLSAWPYDGAVMIDAALASLGRSIGDELREAAEQAGGLVARAWRELESGTGSFRIDDA